MQVAAVQGRPSCHLSSQSAISGCMGRDQIKYRSSHSAPCALDVSQQITATPRPENCTRITRTHGYFHEMFGAPLKHKATTVWWQLLAMRPVCPLACSKPQMQLSSQKCDCTEQDLQMNTPPHRQLRSTRQFTISHSDIHDAHFTQPWQRRWKTRTSKWGQACRPGRKLESGASGVVHDCRDKQQWWGGIVLEGRITTNT